MCHDSNLIGCGAPSWFKSRTSMPILNQYLTTWPLDQFEFVAFIHDRDVHSRESLRAAYGRFNTAMNQEPDPEIVARLSQDVKPGFRDRMSKGECFLPSGAKINESFGVVHLNSLTDFRWLNVDYGVSWDLVLSLPDGSNCVHKRNFYSIGGTENQLTRVYVDADEQVQRQLMDEGAWSGLCGLRSYSGELITSTISINESSQVLLTKLDLSGVEYCLGYEHTRETIVSKIPDAVWVGLFGTSDPECIPWSSMAVVGDAKLI